MKKGIGKNIIDFCKREKGTEEYVRLLYPRENREKKLSAIWRKRLVNIGFLFLFAIICFLYCWHLPGSSRLSEGQYITRGEGDEPLKLTIVGTTAERQWKKTVSLDIKERLFSREEKEKLTVQTECYIRDVLPGKNPSLNKVSFPLHFAASVPGTGVALSWTADDTYIRASGKINRRAISAEGIKTEVMASAKWKNWSKKYYFSVYLMPEELSGEEREKRNVYDAVRREIKKQAREEIIRLPQQVENTALRYKTEESGKDFSLFFISLLLLFLMPALWFRGQKKELKKRETELLLDHPGVVNRIMLLLGAGLTVRKAVERLADEYEQERKKGGDFRYVYEEICVMAQEMRDGISEGRAVERFGKRCGLLPYLRFSSVITQNLKKGADGILAILERESIDALEKRKARVLQLGEIAGTKLLFPMILMLGIVMAIIMVPAFMTL